MNDSSSSNVTVQSAEVVEVSIDASAGYIIRPLLSSIQKAAFVSFEKIDISYSQSDILSKAVICSTRCIAAFSVDAFIKLEYVTGNSFEIAEKYVSIMESQILSAFILPPFFQSIKVVAEYAGKIKYY